MIWMGAGSLTSVWKSAEISLTVTVNAELKQFLFHRLLPFFHNENCMCNIICLALTQSFHWLPSLCLTAWNQEAEKKKPFDEPTPYALTARAMDALNVQRRVFVLSNNRATFVKKQTPKSQLLAGGLTKTHVLVCPAALTERGALTVGSRSITVIHVLLVKGGGLDRCLEPERGGSLNRRFLSVWLNMWS